MLLWLDDEEPTEATAEELVGSVLEALAGIMGGKALVIMLLLLLLEAVDEDDGAAASFGCIQVRDAQLGQRSSGQLRLTRSGQQLLERMMLVLLGRGERRDGRIWQEQITLWQLFHELPIETKSRVKMDQMVKILTSGCWSAE